jgi:hypothetical protein
MKPATLIKDYSRLADINLGFKGQSVIVGLTNNASFTETTPALPAFVVVHSNFMKTMDQAASGDRTAIALKNQARTKLLAFLKQLALNVESLAPGDRAKLLSSGFDLASDGESVPALATPTEFKISDGVNAGELKFSVKRVPQAVSFVYEYTQEPLTAESVWISKASTSREYLFTGLKSGVRIYGRIAVIGRKKQEAYSAILSRVVQ